MSAPLPPLVVLKFGGTSVAHVEGWRTIEARMHQCVAANERPIVVCSALAGVSNLLESLPERALAGECDAVVDDIGGRHRALAASMGVALPPEIETWLDELRRKGHGIALLGEASPRIRASMLAGGELASTRLGAAWLASRGASVTWVDARTLLRARPERGSERRRWLAASCGDDVCEERIARVRAMEGDALLTQGFIASDAEGETVLLGRGEGELAPRGAAHPRGVRAVVRVRVAGRARARAGRARRSGARAAVVHPELRVGRRVRGGLGSRSDRDARRAAPAGAVARAVRGV